MEAVNRGHTDPAQKLFELAGDPGMQGFEMIQNLESIQDVLTELTELAPDLGERP